MRIAGAVLIGGASRRMGVDKATLAVDGAPMAATVAAALADGGCAPVFAVGGPSERAVEVGLEHVVDAPDLAGSGPIAGVVAALRHARDLGCDAVVVAACDLPDLHASTIRLVIDADRMASATVASAAGRRHPTLARWTVADVERLAASALEPPDGPRGRAARGGWSLHAALESLDAVDVPVPAGDVLNANVPADLDGRLATDVSRRVLDAAAMFSQVSEKWTEIDVASLQALGPDAHVIDVREPDEWADGHIPHATHVPLGTVPDHIEAFSGAPTYVVCRSGGRSGRACDFLVEHGCNVVNVAGGMLSWADHGFEMQTGSAGAAET